jgi:protein-S-isoprenylcysteine O-methyltransferase Ste14
MTAAILMFQVQVHLEEEYLLKTHGKDYQEYCRKVRRWM